MTDQDNLTDTFVTLAGGLLGRFAVGFMITMGVLLAAKVMGGEI